MAFYEILTPHKKRKSSFVDFGGNFAGTLMSSVESYDKYMYWVFGIPESEVKTGWYSTKPPAAYMILWEKFVKTHDKPESFDGDYRNLFGFTKAADIFETKKQKY